MCAAVAGDVFVVADAKRSATRPHLPDSLGGNQVAAISCYSQFRTKPFDGGYFGSARTLTRILNDSIGHRGQQQHPLSPRVTETAFGDAQCPAQAASREPSDTSLVAGGFRAGGAEPASDAPRRTTPRARGTAPGHHSGRGSQRITPAYAGSRRQRAAGRHPNHPGRGGVVIEDDSRAGARQPPHGRPCSASWTDAIAPAAVVGRSWPVTTSTSPSANSCSRRPSTACRSRSAGCSSRGSVRAIRRGAGPVGRLRVDRYRRGALA